MLSEREVISTLEMVKNENLDVRTVTLGISLLDCASHDPKIFADNIRRKIVYTGREFVSICDRIGDKYGIKVVNKRIAVSPMAVAAGSFRAQQLVELAGVLDQAASEVGVDFVGGFTALVEKGTTPGDQALIQ
ncbi:MAG: DUF711 family protein, partial [Desulfohalobiaceae bacterium]